MDIMAGLVLKSSKFKLGQIVNIQLTNHKREKGIIIGFKYGDIFIFWPEIVKTYSYRIAFYDDFIEVLK